MTKKGQKLLSVIICALIYFVAFMYLIIDPDLIEKEAMDNPIHSKIENNNRIMEETHDKFEDKKISENNHNVKDSLLPSHIEIEEVNDLGHLEYNLFLDSLEIDHYSDPLQIFPEPYTELEGILTFRGNHLRNTASYGKSDITEKKLETIWSFTTQTSSWGGGAGWTGQPAIVKWPQETKQIMNLEKGYIENEGFTEVIYASLDGNVYFLDLKTGVQTRTSIPVNNPIKGSLSIDPRGYPLLYVGEGIPENGSIGFNIYSLINHSLLFRIDGLDSLALRQRWGAFDSSAIINRETDTLLVGGENGLFYNIKLHTQFDKEERSIAVDPKVLQYRYTIKDNPYQGIENSVAVYKNLAFFADNGGSLQCIDLRSMKPVWALEKTDDTDASITIEVKDGIPYLYTGTEVDQQGLQGTAYLRKINGLTGEILWQVNYEAQSYPEVNGGMLATNVIGKHNTSNLVIFTVARYGTFNGGLMVALDKSSGKEVWTWSMPHYAWSSPVDVYDQDGNTYLIQCDSMGDVYLLDGETGKELSHINLGTNIEASPAVFDDTIVVATRDQKIVGIKIR
jgi:outer membrane protein assembly factor BamB